MRTEGQFTAPAATWSPPPTPGRTVRGAVDTTAVGTSVGATILALVQVIAFLVAFDALNRRQPDTALATFWGGASLAMGAAALALVAWTAQRRRPAPVLVAGGAGLGLLLGGALAAQLPESFGLLGTLGWVLMELVILAFLLVPIVLFIVMMSTARHRVGWGLALGTIGAHVVAYLLPTLRLMAQMDEMAARAAQAHAPTWAAVATAAVLVGVAMWRRRRDA